MSQPGAISRRRFASSLIVRAPLVFGVEDRFSGSACVRSDDAVRCHTKRDLKQHHLLAVAVNSRDIDLIRHIANTPVGQPERLHSDWFIWLHLGGLLCSSDLVANPTDRPPILSVNVLA